MNKMAHVCAFLAILTLSALTCSVSGSSVNTAGGHPSLARDPDTPQLDVVPYPSDAKIGFDALTLARHKFAMKVVDCSADCDIIQRAIDRYMPLIFKQPGSTGTVFRVSIFENRINATVPTSVSGQLNHLLIKTKTKVVIFFCSASP